MPGAPVADAAAAVEELFERGVTDGLPVVPPTRARVEAAVAASGRPPAEVVGLVAPGFGRATVERVAVNAVMAGCRPEYMPVVLAAVEAMCDEAFDLLGISGTTDSVAPLLLVNGPVRTRLEINGGVGCFGPGWRANATIGRALRLVWVNVGGARPGVISMSTFGSSARYTCCIGEHEEASPWEPFHVERGFGREESTVAALAGEPPLMVSDHQSRGAEGILGTLARSMAVIGNHRADDLGDTLVLLSPEHARTIAGDGWSRTDVRRFLWERLQEPVRKFRAPENLAIAVAGGTAGRFSAVVAGWPFAHAPSHLVLKKIRIP
jgi:hypothetical protein